MNETLKSFSGQFMLSTHLPITRSFFGGMFFSFFTSLGVGVYNHVSSERITEYYEIRNNAARHENSVFLDWVLRLTSPAGYLYFNIASDDLTCIDVEDLDIENSSINKSDKLHIWGDDVIKFEKGKGFSYDTVVLKSGKFLIGNVWDDESWKYTPREKNAKIDQNLKNIEKLEEKAKDYFQSGKLLKAQHRQDRIKELKKENTKIRSLNRKLDEYVTSCLNKVVDKLNKEYREGLENYSGYAH